MLSALIYAKLSFLGEEDILNGTKVMKYCLKPNRFFDNSLADLHFRTAESQVFARNAQETLTHHSSFIG